MDLCLFLFLEHVRCVSVHYIFRWSVGVFARGIAVVDTHPSSWRASWLLMFLCKHRAALRGTRDRSLTILSTTASYSIFTFMCIFSANHFYSFNPSWIHSSSHTNILHLSLSFPLTSLLYLWPAADQYIITGFEAYSYHCSNAMVVTPATCVTFLPPFFFCAGSKRTTTPWRWSSTTTWTSSVPITLRVRRRNWTQSAMCSTWWSGKTTIPARPSHTTRCAGSAVIRLPLTLPRSSLKSSSVLLRLLLGRSFVKEKATTTSVSMPVLLCVRNLCLAWYVWTKACKDCGFC